MTLKAIRKHKFLTAIGVILLMLFLAAFLAIVFAEPIIKSLTNDKGSEKLERQLAIDGDLDIRWRWGYTQVHVEKIRLSNASGYPEENMLTIDALDFTFKPLKLFVGKLEFGDITINKPHLILDRKSATEANWIFPVFSKENVATETALADSRHDFPIIQKLVLKEGHVIYRDALKGMNLDLNLDSVHGEGEDKNAQTSAHEFKVAGTGTMQKQKFKIEASGGSLDTLRDSTKPFPLALKLAMGPTQVRVEGTFKDPIKLTGIDASLNITGHSMSDIFYLTAIPLPPTPPYTLKGQLTKTNGVWGYEKFQGKVGGSDLSGNLSYDTSHERGFLKAELVSKVMDSRDLGGFIGLSPAGENAAPEQKQAAAEKKNSPKLIPDVPLKLERLRATDLDVSLKAEKIDAPTLPFKGMNVRFDLRDGLLKLNLINVVLADGTIDGMVEINANKDIPPMKMNLNFRKLSLGQFFTNTRFAETTAGFFGGRANLSGSGASLADVLATSNGELTLIMSGGKISLLLVEASDLDIAQLLPRLLGKDKSTGIRCGVLDFDVKDGFLKSKTVVLDTNDSLLMGDVGVDMKREVINVKLDAKPKDSSIFSAQIPITVSGQLKTPSIGLDKDKAGKKGAAAVLLGSLLTPLAAIIPFIEKGDAKNADCRALIGQAGK
ncbi:MAG TPA: AsmA family protein [Cellvibrionaceae bacterium]